MPRTPRMERIEALLADSPNDAFLRYGLAMEHVSAEDPAAGVAILRELITRPAGPPYIPAYLQAGQVLARMDRPAEAVDVLKAGIQAAREVGTGEALHALGEMQGLLATLE